MGKGSSLHLSHYGQFLIEVIDCCNIGTASVNLAAIVHILICYINMYQCTLSRDALCTNTILKIKVSIFFHHEVERFPFLTSFHFHSSKCVKFINYSCSGTWHEVCLIWQLKYIILEYVWTLVMYGTYSIYVICFCMEKKRNSFLSFLNFQ